MKSKKVKHWMMTICLLVIGINQVTLSQSNEPQMKIHSKILEPIVVLEKEETIQTQMDENSFPMEYHFSICNYREEEINEVEFEYTIEIKNSAENFPVSCQLWDCDKDSEIPLLNGKSEKLTIKKSVKEIRNFKLLLEWRELSGDMAEHLQIRLKINVIQSEEGKSVKS